MKKLLLLPHDAILLAIALAAAITFAPLLLLAQTYDAVGGMRGWGMVEHGYVAKLNGANQVPPVSGSSTTGGDQRYMYWSGSTTPWGTGVGTTGNFLMKVSDDKNAVHFVLDLKNGRNITDAHLHCAVRGKNGPVVLPLFGKITGGVNVHGELTSLMLTDANVMSVVGTGSATGTLTSMGTTYSTSTSTTTTSTTTDMWGGCPVSISDIESLISAADSGYIYANVHSTDYPNGVARGQLHMAQSAGSGTSTTSSSTISHGAVGQMLMLQFQMRAALAEMRDTFLSRLGVVWNL